MRAVTQQRAAGTVAQQGVAIELEPRVKAGVKARVHVTDAAYGHIVWQAVIQRGHQLVDGKARVNVNMRRHGQGVHAAIRAAGRLDADQVADQVSHGGRNRALDGAVRSLALPAVEAFAVELQIKHNPAHIEKLIDSTKVVKRHTKPRRHKGEGMQFEVLTNDCLRNPT
jgi:hypothetical protein